jgi:hypothetical protein
MTPYMADLVQAAQDYDRENRSAAEPWTRVPDEQVRRLLTGAGLFRPGDGRPCTVVDQIRWAFEFARDRYGRKAG